MSDLESTRLVIKGQLRVAVEDLQEEIDRAARRLAKGVVNGLAGLKREIDANSREVKAWKSQILKTVDDYSGMARKVDHAQVIVDGRLTQIERRLAELERP